MTQSSRRRDPRRSWLMRVVGVCLLLGLPLVPSASLDQRPLDWSEEMAASDGGNGLPAAIRESAPVLDGYAAAKQQPQPVETGVAVRHYARPGALSVTTVQNDPRCGSGFTSAAPAGTDQLSCFHSALDPLPPVDPPAASAAKAAPVCLGNGVNGPRVQLVYMYVEGQPDRTAFMAGRIINEFVPSMEAVFRETSRFQGREIGMRLHMPGCQLTVDTLQINADDGAPDDPFAMHSRLTSRLVEAGYTSTDRKYVLWFDGGNKGACGVAPALTPGLEQGYNPTPVTASNIGWQFAIPETAIVFRYGFPHLGDAGRHTPECWGRGGTGATTELHELIHNLGGVNRSSPNNNGADSHCLDDNDIMCQVGSNGRQKFIRCNTVIEQLDCGSDDYFNVRPTAGSYLSTHWNTANSKFLGDAIVHDAVPLDIPRP